MTVSFDSVGINATELVLLAPDDAIGVMIDIAEFGFKHLRVEIPMQLVAPTAGNWVWGPTTYLGKTVAGVQLLVQTAAELGLELLPILGVHMPTWAWKPRFQEFCSRAHDVLQADAYEIMNETNLAAFSENKWAKGTFLAPLLKQARLSIPAPAKIVSGGLAAAVTYTGWAFTPWPTQFHNDSPEDYLKLVIQQNAPFDIAGYHPYSIKDDLSTYEAPSPTQKMLMKADNVRALAQTPVWATEWGFHTGPMTATQVAGYIQTQLPFVDLKCERQYLFCWRNYAPHGANYGLVDANNVPRQPIYDVVHSALSQP